MAILNSLIASHYNVTFQVLDTMALTETLFQTMLSPTVDLSLFYQDKYYRTLFILALIAIAQNLEQHPLNHSHIMLALINIIDFHVSNDNKPSKLVGELEEEDDEDDDEDDEDDEDDDDYDYDDMGMYISEKVPFPY